MDYTEAYSAGAAEEFRTAVRQAEEAAARRTVQERPWDQEASTKAAGGIDVVALMNDARRAMAADPNQDQYR